MSKVLEKQKNSVNIKEKYSKEKKSNKYYENREAWEGETQQTTNCPICSKWLKESEAMNGPNNQLIHEECYEPGEKDY